MTTSSIKKLFLHYFLIPIIVPFVPYTPRPDGPQSSQAPPESQTVETSHVRRPDTPRHSQAPPESQSVELSHVRRPGSPRHPQSPPGSETSQISHTPRPDSSRRSQSPHGSQTIQVLQANPINPPHQPAPRPRGERPHADGYIMMMSMETALVVMGFCFAAAGVALQALQTPKPLPMTFSWFCVLFMLSFVSVFLSIHIGPLYPRASLVMNRAAILLGSTAFMLAISMNFPSPYLEISMALFFGLVLVVILANIIRGG